MATTNNLPSGSGKNEQQRFHFDNCIRSHAAALLSQANLDETQIIYCHFRNSVLESPYSIVYDRKWQCVVVSIRGTLSLEDCLTDVLCDQAPLDAFGARCGFDGTGEKAHTGMLKTAEWIYSDIERHGALAYAMKEYEGCSLRVTGHSLGAGVATLLSLLLRKTYKNLKCLAYSPPGGLLTLKTALYCKEFLTSFILNNDMIPRLSRETMENLRDNTLSIVSRMKVSKSKILRSISSSDKFDGQFDERELLYDEGCVPESNFVKQIQKYQEVQEKIKESRGRDDSRLYPPGRIIHFLKTEEIPKSFTILRKLIPFCSSYKRAYVGVEASNEDFGEIIISSSMALDHFPDRVCLSIEELVRQFDCEGCGIGEEI